MKTTIPFDVRNRFTGEAQFTAQIDCEPDEPPGVKLGLAVRWAVKNRANLTGANLIGANLYGANLTGANLTGMGDRRFVKTLQADTWAVAYTADTMQIGCQRHPIADWWEFTDAQIAAMDPKALGWWRVWRPVLRKIIKASPAEPTGYVAPAEEANNG